MWSTPATLDGYLGILQQVLRVDRPEVCLPEPNTAGMDVYRDLVDQTEGQGLTADLADRDRHVALTGGFLRRRDCRAHVLDEAAGRLGVPPVRARAVRDHDDRYVTHTRR